MDYTSQTSLQAVLRLGYLSGNGIHCSLFIVNLVLYQDGRFEPLVKNFNENIYALMLNAKHYRLSETTLLYLVKNGSAA